MNKQESHHQLVHILQAAYSGELAAAYAYRGHWKSVKNASEREHIARIELEEWVHREKVGHILASLGSGPVKAREMKMWIIGRIIGMLCHVIGWFLPMYFAGRLESQNVKEYESAAFYAAQLGLTEFESDLLIMSAVEKEHEIFFMSVVSSHRLLPLMQTIFGWGEASYQQVSETKPDAPLNR